MALLCTCTVLLLITILLYSSTHCNLTKALCTTSPSLENLKTKLNLYYIHTYNTIYILTAMKNTIQNLSQLIFITINGTISASQLVKSLFTLA